MRVPGTAVGVAAAPLALLGPAASSDGLTPDRIETGSAGLVASVRPVPSAAR